MSKKKFVTITLNPSLDRTLVTHYLAVGYQNRTPGPERLDPAGQGVNVARALRQLECETHAIIVLGDDATGRAYQALIADEGSAVTIINVKGQTRTNTVILDEGNHQETQITTEGAQITEADVQQVIKVLRDVVVAGDVVTYAGSLPNGASVETYARLIEIAHAAGAEVALATGGLALGEALKAQPELVAVSQIECEAFFNYPIRVPEDVIASGHKLRAQGAGKALVEMREAGSAVLVTEGGEWKIDLPDVMQGTSTGIWEAMLAGFLAGRAKHKPLEESLEWGAAAAAYTGAEIGTEFGSLTEAKEYRADVDVTSVDES
jgi:1-phosphofructokinase family hexose kinase